MQRLQAWWLELPLSYRVNALLYLLGAAALLVLLTTLFSGDDKPRQIQVGAGVVTTTTARQQPSTTPVTASDSSTSILTTTIPAGVAVPAGGGDASSGSTNTTTSSPSSGGGAGGGGGGGGGGGITVPTSTTTPSGLSCRNSGDERCGDFRWDPPVGPSAPVTMTVSPGSASPRVGNPLTFLVTASDADHPIPSGCWAVSFGDGSPEERGDCPAPPACPPHYGPWTPPPTQLGVFQRPFSHTFQQPGTFVMRFTISSISGDTCLELDPWANATTRDYQITIVP